MLTFKKMLVMVKGGLLSPLVRCLFRRQRVDDDDDSPLRVDDRQAEREMVEDEGTAVIVDSNVQIASGNQTQCDITAEAEDDDQTPQASTESCPTSPRVAQLPQQSPPLLPSNIVCILPNSELGIQFAEAIRALSPPKTEIETLSSTRQFAIHPDEIPSASNPPIPPPLPEALKRRTTQLSITRPAVSPRALTRSKKRPNVFRFMDLPAEIRWMVYQIHFESLDINVTKCQELGRYAASSSSRVRRCVVRISASTIRLRYVSRQIYDEATAVMLNCSNFDLMKCTEGPHKLYAWTLPPEILLMMRRFSCNNVYFVRQLWKAKRTRESEEVVGDRKSISDVLQLVDQSKQKSNFQIGSLTSQQYTINRLKEITLYTSTDLFRGLTAPQWLTEHWFSDEDTRYRRVLEIVEVRELLEEFEKYATRGCILRLKTVKGEFIHREIELKANSSVIVRGVPNAWHQLAERRIQQWLQLSKGKSVTFEDNKHRSHLKARMPIVGRS